MIPTSKSLQYLQLLGKTFSKEQRSPNITKASSECWFFFIQFKKENDKVLSQNSRFGLSFYWIANFQQMRNV